MRHSFIKKSGNFDFSGIPKLLYYWSDFPNSKFYRKLGLRSIHIYYNIRALKNPEKSHACTVLQLQGPVPM